MVGRLVALQGGANTLYDHRTVCSLNPQGNNGAERGCMMEITLLYLRPPTDGVHIHSPKCIV